MSVKQIVLIVDDNKINRLMLKKILENDYEVVQAENGKQAMDLFKKGLNASAVILDLNMPVMNGFDFLENFYIDINHSNIPVIITTVCNDQQSELRALKLGAWDYITKPYNIDILKFRLTNAILRCKLNNFNRIKYLAEFDTLTGIYNKNKFFDATKDMLKRYAEKQFIFIRLDIDRFKLINSFFGASEGDSILKYIADGIHSRMKRKKCCSYGRINSDRFAICIAFSGDIYAELQAFCDDFNTYLSNYNKTYKLIMSIGAYLIEDNSLPVEIIYDRATMAANKCKGNDMEYFAIYDKKMSDELIASQEISNEMNDALLSNQFVVYLQPKYNLQTKQISGAEALVRWQHPKKGLIPPDEFIPIFEKNGFIQKLDEYVWEKCCQYIRNLLDKGITPCPISVNMSRVDTLNSKLCDVLKEKLNKYNLTSNFLNIEITESAYMENSAQMIETINDLKAVGFKIEMDDFGKGYSSLNMISELPIDKLKLDMRFLQKRKSKMTTESVVKLIVDLAKTLNLKVVAEGIETQEDLSFLKEIGCGYGQGYYFCKPLPYEKFEELMKKQNK